MPRRTDVIYRYDGSFEGLLCCVYRSYYERELPAGIESAGAEQMQLYAAIDVETDIAHSARVARAIREKISPQAYGLVRRAYFTCLEEREMHILRFLRLGFAKGGAVMQMTADARVNIIYRAVRNLALEKDHMSGFLRFSDYGGILFAQIEPKNDLLPLMAAHLRSRFGGEKYVVYDRAHGRALVHGDGTDALIELDGFEPPPADGAERHIRGLWRRFYDTVAVEGRENPRCRMSHMPKRFWKNMTEFQNEKDSPERTALASDTVLQLLQLGEPKL
ncbi:MAG: TIGR03915 family putative DNA repair protein [Clostridia bacterium]|nr:TIGR03915 family putative DNA repair protein [Clostridia bacterium]